MRSTANSDAGAGEGARGPASRVNRSTNTWAQRPTSKSVCGCDDRRPALPRRWIRKPWQPRSPHLAGSEQNINLCLQSLRKLPPTGDHCRARCVAQSTASEHTSFRHPGWPEFGPGCGRIRRARPEYGVDLSQFVSTAGRVRPKCAGFRTEEAEVGPCRATLGKSGRFWAEIGRNRPMFVERGIWLDFDRICAVSVEVVGLRANTCLSRVEPGPIPTDVGRTSTGFR